MTTLFLALTLLAQSLSQPQSQLGTITGRLSLSDGGPAANVFVALLPVRPNGTALQVLSQGTGVAMTYTDSSGRYRFAAVPPNRYFIAAGVTDTPTFYPGVPTQAGVTSLSTAAGLTAVAVGSGLISEGLDFRLATAPGLKISGRVVREGDSSGHAGGFRVRLTGTGRAAFATTSPDGSFEFPGILPGIYQVGISSGQNIPAAAIAAGGPLAPISVEVRDKELSGIDLKVPLSVGAAANVTGTVAVDGGGIVPRIMVQFAATTGASATLPGGSRGASTNGSTFTVQNLPPGEYNVTVRPITFDNVAPGYAVKSITSGSIDLLRQPLKVTPTDWPQVAITLGVGSPLPWVKVNGRVTGSNTVPTPANTISLSGGLLSETLFAPIKPDGSFEFPMVLRGNISYTAALIPNADPFNRTIVVGNGDVTNIEIPMALLALKVEGRVTNEAQLRQLGQLAPTAILMARLTEGMAGQRINPANPPKTSDIASDGSFQFPSVQPGTYQLTFSRRCSPDCDVGIGMPGGTTVVVADKDITGLAVSVSAAAGPGAPTNTMVSVSGTVTLDVGVLRPRFQLTFAGDTGLRASPVSSPTFTAQVPAGAYRVTVAGLPPGYVVKSMTDGTTDLLTQSVNVFATAPPRIAITLGVTSPPPGVRVSGRVTGIPLSPGASISLSGAALAEPLNAPLTGDGSFELARVLPDTYTVRILPDTGAPPRTIMVGATDVTNLVIDTKSPAVGDFVKIQAGEFSMGCSTGDSQCKDDEKPAHVVRISKGFEIGKYEVTQAQWQAVMGNNPSGFKSDSRPVENVRWNDVQEYLTKLNARNDGYRYRLPTEAEWEYVARGGATGAQVGTLDLVGWYDRNAGYETHPVGQKQPNAWGVYDMRGNVAEWTADWYDAKSYATGAATDPKGPAGGQERVLRGGDWFNLEGFTRVSNRDQFEPGLRSDRIGFRVVREGGQ